MSKKDKEFMEEIDEMDDMYEEEIEEDEELEENLDEEEYDEEDEEDVEEDVIEESDLTHLNAVVKPDAEEMEEDIDTDIQKAYGVSMESLPEGLRNLIKGYIDYAKEVVVDRAIPGIDGFKPSQRRILYNMKEIEKVRVLSKCANVAGTTMKLHPHGDQSIYDTMVRMVGSSLHLNVPYLKGKGSFGKVFSSETQPAASRYTECMLEKVTDELFKGIDGVEKVPNYDETLQEPLLLPVSFPNILCNPAQGIAVGIAANIPAFNFHELIKSTIEYIETGDIKEPLCPDFTTGGYYVKNKHELKKLMSTGNAKIKLRGKWHIEGKIIVIDEIPYYSTIEEIIKAVKDLPNVVDVKDETDKKGLRIAITCLSKKVVDEVLREVLRVSTLQMTMTSNIVIIVDNQPRVIGVKEVLSEWIKFRKDVVDKELNKKVQDIETQILRYSILVDLMTTEKREPFLQTLMHKGREVTKELLQTYYPTTDESVFNWILEKSIGSLSGIGNKQRNQIIELKEKKVEVEQDLQNIDKLIIKELQEVSKKYSYPRKTIITDEDYVFEERKGKAKPEAYQVLVVLDGKFIKKLKNTPTNQKIDGVIKCMSDDTISLLDSAGRLIRVQVEHLEFVTEREKGTYIPLYLGEEDDKSTILDYEIIKNKKVGYLFKDGYASIIDYNEWYSAKRKTKLTPEGLAPKYIDLFLGTFRMDRDYIVLLTKKGKLGVVKNEFLEKSRKARTKLIHVGKGDEVVNLCSASEKDLEDCIANKERFIGCFRVIGKADGFSQEVFDRLKNKNNSLLE